MLINSAHARRSNNMKIFLTALLCFLLAIPPVSAQDVATPPEEGALTDNATPDVAPAEEPVPEIEAGLKRVQENGAEKPASVLPQDPCPLPSAEMAQAPDDLARIQSDIDRYTLCMERAQLLQRLNDVAVENQEKLNEANGAATSDISAANPGMQLGNNLPSFEQQRQQIMGSVNASDVAAAPVDVAPVVDTTEWFIMKILGSGGALSAQVAKSDGTLAQVKVGDSLPEGIRIDAISSTGVMTTQEGESKALRWREPPPPVSTGS